MRTPYMFGALAISLATAGIPVLAAAQPNTMAASHQATMNGRPNQLIRKATQVVKTIGSDHGIDDLLGRAKGVLVVPGKATSALGVISDGEQGLLMKRTSDGWSQPAFLSIGAISLGPQNGGEASKTVMLLMTPKAMSDFTEANDLSLGANTGLVVVEYSSRNRAAAGQADVIVWSNQSGNSLGSTVTATNINSDTKEDHTFYGRHLTTEAIVNGNAPHEDTAIALVNALSDAG